MPTLAEQIAALDVNSLPGADDSFLGRQYHRLGSGLEGLNASLAGLIGDTEGRQAAQARQEEQRALAGTPTSLAEKIMAAGLESAPALGLAMGPGRLAGTLIGPRAGALAMGGTFGVLDAPDIIERSQELGNGTAQTAADVAANMAIQALVPMAFPRGVEALTHARIPARTTAAEQLGNLFRNVPVGAADEAKEEVIQNILGRLRENAVTQDPQALPVLPTGPRAADVLEQDLIAAGAGAAMGGPMEAVAPTLTMAQLGAGRVADAAGSALTPAMLAARLRFARPEMGPQPSPQAAPSPMAAGVPSYADLTEQALAAEAVRRGLPQDFAPPMTTPMPQGPAGQGFAGYAEPQPGDLSQVLAAMFRTGADPASQEAPRVEALPASIPAGPVPGAAPVRADAPAPAPVAPQPETPAAPVTPPAAAPGVQTVTPSSETPAAAASSPTVKDSLQVGQRIRWAKGAPTTTPVVENPPNTAPVVLGEAAPDTTQQPAPAAPLPAGDAETGGSSSEPSNLIRPISSHRLMPSLIVERGETRGSQDQGPSWWTDGKLLIDTDAMQAKGAGPVRKRMQAELAARAARGDTNPRTKAAFESNSRGALPAVLLGVDPNLLNGDPADPKSFHAIAWVQVGDRAYAFNAHRMAALMTTNPDRLEMGRGLIAFKNNNPIGLIMPITLPVEGGSYPAERILERMPKTSAESGQPVSPTAPNPATMRPAKPARQPSPDYVGEDTVVEQAPEPAYAPPGPPAMELPVGDGPVSPEQIPDGFNTQGRGDPQAQRFVTAPDGGLNWGAIDAEVSHAIHHQAGPIRLQVGWHGGPGTGFGLVHLRLGNKYLGDHLDGLSSVLHDYDEIRQDGKRLILVKQGTAKRPDGAVVELVPGDHYSVITAYGMRPSKLKGVPLWSRSTTRTHAPQPGTPGLPDTANEGRSGPPKAAQQSDDVGTVPPSTPEGNQEESAPITDVGEKIGGARKDRINVADLATMSSEERQSAVKRSAVWPEPDPQELIDSGMPLETAWMVMRAYGGIAKEPIIDAKSASNPEARDAAIRAYVETVGRLRDHLTAARTPADVHAAFKGEWPELYQRGMISDYTGYYAARDRYRIVARSNQLANAHADVRNMRKDLAEGWPNKAAWQSRYRVHESYDSTRPGWVVRARNDALRREEGAQGNSVYPTREEAEAEAQRRYDGLRRENGGKEPQRPLKPDARREGPDRREGDISADDLRTTYGFRGIEFGNWTNQADRQQAVNQAFDGLADLADLMGVPAAALSLDGKLGLAFGARGSGRFAGHYEPGKVVINLTRTKGAGIVSHEWAHGLDNYFGKMGASGDAKAYSSTNDATAMDEAGKAGIRPEVMEAWRGVRMAMMRGADGKPSNYFRESRNADKGPRRYWSSPHEMFARAFEGWVAQRLGDKGMYSPYLVQGVPDKSGDIATASEWERRYPMGDDAKRINAAIDRLVATLKTEQTERGTTRLYDLESEGGAKLIIDERAATKRMGGMGRYVRTPEGWAFRGRNGLEVDIRQPTNEQVSQADAEAGTKVNGWFQRDPVTGRPTVYLVPGRTGPFTLDHEMIHAAVATGIISRTELAALVRIGRAKGIMSEVRARGYQRQALAEEVAAHVIEAIHAGRITVKPSGFTKVMDWLRRLVSSLGLDVRTDAQKAVDVAGGRPWGRNAQDGGEGKRFSLSAVDPAAAPMPDEIDVDGVQRPTLNSNGKRIAQTEEAVRNFWKWFGDSKVVDEQGRPLVVYHGSGKAFASFDPAMRGKATGARSARMAFFFVDSSGTASLYASSAEDFATTAAYERIQRLERAGRFDEADAMTQQLEDGTYDFGVAPQVYPVYLRIAKPLEHDFKGGRYSPDDHNLGGMIADAKEAGDDGAIFRNFEDNPSIGGPVADHFAVFSPTQIKSATGNRGTFDANDPNIRMSLPAADPDTSTPQERMDASHGAPPGTRNADQRREVAVSFRRHFAHLDPKDQAEAIRILREFEATRDSAGSWASRRIGEFVEGLTPEQAQKFGRIIELHDIVRQIEAGEFVGADSQGRTPEQILATVQGDLADLEAKAAPATMQAVAKRREFIRDHARQMVDAGLLDESVLGDDRYFHRQVLAHMANPFAGLVGSDQVRERTRGFQRERSGGTAADIPFYGENASRDFNTAYHQAEFEYLSQSYQELAKVDALAKLRQRFDRLPEVKAEAKARNRAAMDEWWQREVEAQGGGIDHPERGWDFAYRQTIAMNHEALADLAADSDGRWGGPFDHVWEALARARQDWSQRNRKRDPADREAFRFDHPEWWPALSWLVAHPEVTVQAERTVNGKGGTQPYEGHPSIHAGAILTAIKEREEFTKKTLTEEHLAGRGPKYLTWEDVAKELTGYTEWQPEQGLQMGRGYVVEDKAVRAALVKAGIDPDTFADHAPDVLPVGESEARRGLVVYGRKPVWLIPEDLAAQLNEMETREPRNPLAKRLEIGMRSWKQWILMNPFSVIRYNLNNLTGDLDVALTNPRVLLEAGKDGFRLARELWSFTQGRPMSADRKALFEAAEKAGLIDSGVQVAELPDVDKIPGLAVLFGKKPETWGERGAELITRYFGTVQRFSRWREGILRLAAARRFYAEITPSRRRYVASRRDEMDQLYDQWGAAEQRAASLEAQMAKRRTAPTDAEVAALDEARADARAMKASIAAKLAREFIGDYGALSVSGQWMRRSLIPFWSWMEINLPRYARLIKNARYEGGGGTAQAAGAALAMTGGMGLRMVALTGAIYAFNAMMKAALDIEDEDDPNTGASVAKMQIIVGKTGDGKVIAVSVAGAMADALSWFDADDALKHGKDLVRGMREGRTAAALRDVAADVGMAPVNRLANSVNPLAKETFAQAAGRDWFPDVRSPRPIGDRGEHLAGMFGTGVRDMVRVAKDKEPWWKPAASSVVREWDPKTQATFRIRDEVEGWASRNGVTIRPLGGEPTERSTALREARMAFARGDQDRARRWLERYYEAGGKPASLGSSRAGMHPLSALAMKDRPAFIRSLDADGRRALERAEAQWREFWDQPNEGFRALAIKAFRERSKRTTGG